MRYWLKFWRERFKLGNMIRDLFKDEDRALTVLVGASAAIMTLGLLVAVVAMLLLR